MDKFEMEQATVRALNQPDVTPTVEKAAQVTPKTPIKAPESFFAD